MSNKRILIVDEEDLYVTALKDRIETTLGPDLFDVALSGEEALELLDAHKYGVVLLDMMLPLGEKLELPASEPDLMYGLFLLRLIRRKNPTQKVIVYTVLDEDELRDEINLHRAQYMKKIDDVSAYNELVNRLSNIIKS